MKAQRIYYQQSHIIRYVKGSRKKTISDKKSVSTQRMRNPKMATSWLICLRIFKLFKSP